MGRASLEVLGSNSCNGVLALAFSGQTKTRKKETNWKAKQYSWTQTISFTQFHKRFYYHLFFLNPKLDARISFVRPFVCMSRSYYPPWILKRAGLESSGRRLISSIGKTKIIAFFFLAKKNIFKNF